MPLSFSNTGSTDLRLTEVQQPNTVATLSTSRSCFAFSANNGQLDAGSTTTGSIMYFLPETFTPPALLISSKVNSRTSLSEVSLMAIVPLSECSTPTLTVSAADVVNATSATLAASTNFLRTEFFMVLVIK